MYKAAALVAALAAALTYFVYLSPTPIFDYYYSQLNATTNAETTMQSVSRQVIKKVLSVEQEEVRSQWYVRRGWTDRVICRVQEHSCGGRLAA